MCMQTKHSSACGMAFFSHADAVSCFAFDGTVSSFNLEALEEVLSTPIYLGTCYRRRRNFFQYR